MPFMNIMYFYYKPLPSLFYFLQYSPPHILFSQSHLYMFRGGHLGADTLSSGSSLKGLPKEYTDTSI